MKSIEERNNNFMEKFKNEADSIHTTLTLQFNDKEMINFYEDFTNKIKI